jgi:hypothetical protein
VFAQVRIGLKRAAVNLPLPLKLACFWSKTRKFGQAHSEASRKEWLGRMMIPLRVEEQEIPETAWPRYVPLGSSGRM